MINFLHEKKERFHLLLSVSTDGFVETEYQKRPLKRGGYAIMKVKPLNDRVLVIRVEEEQKSAGGIIIPDTAKEKPQEGKIVSAGPGKRGDDGKRTPLEVKAGDRVLFSKYAGTEINIDGEEHIVMKEDDILGVIE
jgi:chaperonin GroES